MPPDRPVSSTWSFAQRALACSKPRCRTVDQINVIADMLTHLAIFEGVESDDLLAVAYFIEAKHSEAGECVLSKGQPLEQWCLLLHGSALLTRYSTQRGSEQTTIPLGPSDSWSEAALLHSTHLRRSSITVVAGPQGCFTLRLRYSDYDAMNDFRNPLQLLPPEGTQGPLAEITVAQRRAGAMALLCCFLRRLASARPPDERTPEEASELEPFLSSLPAYRAYPQELVACLAAACRSQSLPAGSLVYEHSTLADAHLTVLSGEVQLRKLGGQPGGEETEADSGGAAAAAPGTSAAAGTSGAAGGSTAGGAASGTGAGVRPAPPPGPPQDSPLEGSSGRLNIRARLRREREARKLMQKQLDEYVSRLDSDAASADGKGGSGSLAPIKDPVSASPVDWTRVFMQKAMRTVEPVWKALHPADKAPRRRPGVADGTFDIPLDGSEGPITEVAQLLGPAAAKAYYRGLRSQGYSEDADSPSPSGSSGSGSGGGARPSDTDGAAAGSNAVRDKWKRRMFSVDGPETDHERTLRSMAMRASRIIRERHARSRGRGGFDAEEVEEMYGQQFASLTRGSPVGELSTVMLHSAMRKETAVAGPGGCELLLVDWETYQQGILGARAAVLARAATFLSSLSKERLNRLAELCLCLSVDTATLLARQGTPLEHMVVVQEGEVTLLHEPSAALHTRIASVRGLAVSGSRNGRTQLLPLLATLNTSNLPISTIASGGAGAGGTGSAAAASVGPTPSGGSFTSGQTSPVEITLQGLLLGEIGAGGIVGEALLGSRGGGSISSISSTAAAAAANGHSDPSQHGHGHGQGHGHGNVHGTATGTGTDPHRPLSSVSPVLPIEGPKWPATVLATRASVLLVIPRSVLYMSDFDSIRSDLMRFSLDRRAWLGRRVEAAYRAAAAPTTTPAVFATAAGASQSSSSAAAVPQSHPLLRRPVLQSSTGDGSGDGGNADATPRPNAPTTPHTGSFPRRAASSDVSGGNLHVAANGGAGSGTESTGSTLHHPICRRRSVESLQRSTSPGHPAAAVATGAATTSSATVTTSTVTALASPGNSAAIVIATAGSGHILTRPNSKWDFLDGPTSATGSVNAGGGPATSVGMEISSSVLGPLTMATGSLTRSGGAGVSIMDSAGSITLPSGMTLTGSFTSGSALVGLGGGAMPLRRPSSGNLRALKDSAAAVTPISVSSFAAANSSVSGGVGADLPGLSPAQQALLEVGLDPYFAGSDGGGGTAIERHGSASLAGVVLAQGTGSVGSGSSVTPLPALNQPSGATTGTSSRGLTPVIVAGGGSNSGSPAASADFDAMRTAGLATPFRSPNALTPTSYRTNGSSGASGLPAALTMSSSVSLLDSAYGSASGIALSPSTALAGLPGYSSSAATAAGATTGVRMARASYCGGITTGRRRTDMEGNASGVALTPAAGQLTAPSPALTPRVPALQALDALETTAAATASTPPSPGLYARSARSSYTGGMTPRIASVDSSWLQMGGRGAFPGGLRGRSVTRDSNGYTTDAGGGGFGVAPTEVEMEEEAALARSLVPKNQAGLFMVRGGAASTPAKLPAARRIAGCF